MPVIAPNTEFVLEGLRFNCLVDGNEKGNDDRTGPWRTVVFQCDWADSDDLCDALMGIAPYSSTTPGAFTAIAPYRYPMNANLLCRSVRCVGVGPAQPDPKLIAYDLAHITAMFRVPEWNAIDVDLNNIFGNDPDVAVPWMSCSTRGGFREYPVDKGTLTFQSTGAPVTQSRNVRIPVLHKTVRRGNVPYLYDNFLDTLTGQINSVPIFNKPRGTVLFNDYESDPVTLADGSKANDYTFFFEWRRYDWNKTLEPGTLTTWDFVRDPAGSLEFNYADISQAITFGLS